MRPYPIALLQTQVRQVRDPASAGRTIRQNLNRIAAMMAYAERFSPGGPPRLFLLPEFALTGFALETTAEDWIAMAARVPGWETELLGELAVRHRAYVACAVFEYDPEWPGRLWNTGLILDPDGRVILRHRKHLTGGTSGRGKFAITSPGDVYTEYVVRYGADALFPVVDTPLGRLGCLVSYEITCAELARCLAMRGAEVILHLSGEPWGALDGWWPLKRARAMDNLVYVLSVNHGVYVAPADGAHDGADPDAFSTPGDGEFAPLDRSRGRSAVFAYDGGVPAAIEGPGEAVLHGTVDLDRLRLARMAPGNNRLAHLRAQLLAPFYAAFPGLPNDAWAETPIRLNVELREKLNGVIAGLEKSGLLTRPSD